MSDSIVKITNLGKIYQNGAKKLEVLKGINLEVKKEELLVIQGPSGAGKSTLLHLMGGLDKPTKGSVFVNDTDIYKINDNKRAEIRNKEIGFIFQFYNLLPELTALENVILPALMNNSNGLNKKTIQEEGKNILSSVKLQDRLMHKPFQLSGGELQRVAIARALINNPEIIFCDEPTGNLDSKSGDEICDLLLKLNKEKKKTVVIVTHEQKIASLAKKVIHIQDGQLKQ